jgi:hypothetical protein
VFRPAENRCAVALAVTWTFAAGALVAWNLKPTDASAQAGKRSLFEYRVLQDRELFAEASAPTKDQFQEKLGKIASQGFELVNPVPRYFEDKGFCVVTGAFPDLPGLPDRRAVLLLRRERQ